jgi:hypothetical protein
MMLGVALASQGCSAAPDEESDSAEGAASAAGTMNVSNAKVSLCDDEVGGCPKCDEKIGDYTLTADEREACTLKVMRGGLKDRINVLISTAGRQGLFLRTAGEESTLKLARIKVVPAVGDSQNAKSQFTKLSGSFTTGEDPNASGVKGGVSVYSVFMPVKVIYEFEDKTGAVLRQEAFSMKNTYNLTPFFFLKAELAVNLSVGSILSKFGGGPVASSLLSALGGNASLHVDAAHEVRWTTPVCADSSDDKGSSNKSALKTFDNDFLKNVLVPLCLQYKKDNGADVQCSLDPNGNFQTDTLLEKAAGLTNRRVLPVHGCTAIETPLFGTDTYMMSFVAPAAWGFDVGAEAFLYKANENASDVWKRHADASVIGVDGKAGEACGIAKLKAGEVCVHAKTKTPFFAGSCTSIQGAGARGFGIVQTSNDKEEETLQYRLP